MQSRHSHDYFLKIFATANIGDGVFRERIISWKIISETLIIIEKIVKTVISSNKNR